MNKLMLFNAKQLREARHGWTGAFHDYFEQVEPLSEDRFWALMDPFRKEVLHCVFGCSGRRLKDGAHEFFRAAHTKEANYTFNEAVQFAKGYRALSKSLYQPLFDIVKNRGDDAYGDLLDSLPLAGRKVCEKALASQYIDNADFEAKVAQVVKHREHVPAGDYKQFAEFILHGENYVATALYDKASDFMVSELLNN